MGNTSREKCSLHLQSPLVDTLKYDRGHVCLIDLASYVDWNCHVPGKVKPSQNVCRHEIRKRSMLLLFNIFLFTLCLLLFAIASLSLCIL